MRLKKFYCNDYPKNIVELYTALPIVSIQNETLYGTERQLKKARLDLHPLMKQRSYHIRLSRLRIRFSKMFSIQKRLVSPFLSVKVYRIDRKMPSKMLRCVFIARLPCPLLLRLSPERVTLEVPMKNALLVPGVFFANLFSAVVICAFFSGIALRYEMAIPFVSESAGLLLLCMAQRACYVLPVAVMLSIIGVYTFLMRHPAKLGVALSLLLACIVFTVTVIIPACYAQFSAIEHAIATYKTTAPIDKALAAFTSKPLFLILLQHGTYSLFSYLYTAYTSNFTIYLFFVSALYFCVSSFWFVCIITRWNLFNLLFLMLLFGALLLVFPSMQLEGFQTALVNLHITNAENGIYGIPLVLCTVGVVFHAIGGLKRLLISSKSKKRSAA